MGWLAFGSVLYQDCLGSCRKCLSNPEFMRIRSTLYHNYPDEIGIITITGLLLEIVLIATFTQRFFAR